MITAQAQQTKMAAKTAKIFGKEDEVLLFESIQEAPLSLILTSYLFILNHGLRRRPAQVFHLTGRCINLCDYSISIPRTDRGAIPVKVIRQLPAYRSEHSPMRQHKNGKSRHAKEKQ